MARSYDWLRNKDVRQKKAIHSLRKESGSLIALACDIKAARKRSGFTVNVGRGEF